MGTLGMKRGPAVLAHSGCGQTAGEVLGEVSQEVSLFQ